MTKLHLKLKLKHNGKKMDREIKENFGYSPSHNKYFDELESIQSELVEFARINYPDVYLEYINSL